MQIWHFLIQPNVDDLYNMTMCWLIGLFEPSYDLVLSNDYWFIFTGYFRVVFTFLILFLDLDLCNFCGKRHKIMWKSAYYFSFWKTLPILIIAFGLFWSKLLPQLTTTYLTYGGTVHLHQCGHRVIYEDKKSDFKTWLEN